MFTMALGPCLSFRVRLLLVRPPWRDASPAGTVSPLLTPNLLNGQWASPTTSCFNTRRWKPARSGLLKIEGYYKYEWRGAAASASLSAVLLAAEAMDQGSHAVIAGLQNAWLRSFVDWEAVVARLVAPHRMFGVRLVVDPSVRTERLNKRSRGQWSWTPTNASSGEESLTVDTTNGTPAEVADLIIKHSRNIRNVSLH